MGGTIIVKPSNYFRKAAKLPLNSSETVKTLCSFVMQVSPRFYAAHDCLLVIFGTQKENARSDALSPVEKVKICSRQPKLPPLLAL